MDFRDRQECLYHLFSSRFFCLSYHLVAVERESNEHRTATDLAVIVPFRCVSEGAGPGTENISKQLGQVTRQDCEDSIG